jgi:hypothetical protein
MQCSYFIAQLGSPIKQPIERFIKSMHKSMLFTIILQQ